MKLSELWALLRFKKVIEEVDVDTSKIKDGIKTTEFWLALLTALLTVANKHLGLDLPVSSIISVAGVVITYIASRTWLKKKSEPQTSEE